jgi:hypothetical protein
MYDWNVAHSLNSPLQRFTGERGVKCHVSAKSIFVSICLLLSMLHTVHTSLPCDYNTIFFWNPSRRPPFGAGKIKSSPTHVTPKKKNKDAVRAQMKGKKDTNGTKYKPANRRQ